MDIKSALNVTYVWQTEKYFTGIYMQQMKHEFSELQLSLHREQ